MAYESGRLKPVAQFEAFVLDLGEDDQQRFSDEPERFLSDLLKEEGAPDPNRVVVRRAADAGNDLINAIIADIESGGTGGGSSHPPVTAIFHEVSGPHPSVYITIIGGA